MLQCALPVSFFGLLLVTGRRRQEEGGGWAEWSAGESGRWTGGGEAEHSSVGDVECVRFLGKVGRNSDTRGRARDERKSFAICLGHAPIGMAARRARVSATTRS